MINNNLAIKIKDEFEKRKELLGQKKDEISEKIAGEDEFTKTLIMYMYAALPLSDLGGYDYDLFKKYAEHGKFLYDNSPYLKGVPDTYFLNYVVCPRINNEDLVECRKFFYKETAAKIEGMGIREAALFLNNYSFENATYHSTSERTASPISVYKAGYGRCGEESTFFVSILRSLGIPARQVYVPRWSHSDSNHAWVEIYAEGKWFYTGACEPKPVLNCGWFSYPASRAMIVHSRVFGDLLEDKDEVTTAEGHVSMINNGGLYSKQKRLKVIVSDEKKQPVKGAKVRFEIVNSSELFSIASLYTDDNGEATVSIGIGAVHIYVTKDELKGYYFCNEDETEAHITVTLEECLDKWNEYLFTAPASSDEFGENLTEEEEKYQEELDKEGEKKRLGRIDSYYDEDFVNGFSEYPQIQRVLKNARGNFNEIKQFLLDNSICADLNIKERLLSSLDQKDCRDTTCRELLDHVTAYEMEKKFCRNHPDAPEKERGCFVDNEAVINSEDIMDEFYRADMDFFTEYVASPKIFIEKITTFRKDIRDILGDSNPFSAPIDIWNYINENIKTETEQEYTTLIASPKSILTTKMGLLISKKVLFVAICRTYGIAARIDMASKNAQYFENGKFVFVEEKMEKSAELEFTFEDDTVPEYCASYSLSKRQDNGDYFVINDERLWLNKERTVQISVIPGFYRLTTCDRTITGSVFSRVMYFYVSNGEKKSVSIRTNSTGNLIETSIIREIKDLRVENPDGSTSEKAGLKGLNVWMFLKASIEPTEHVLNELLELNQMGGALLAPVNIIINDRKELENDLMSRVLGKVEHQTFINTDEAGESLLGKQMSEMTAYPYICLTENDNVIFTVNGYQVGVVDILQRIIKQKSL